MTSLHMQGVWIALVLAASACDQDASRSRPDAPPSTPPPAEVAEELSAADRSYAATATATDLVSALTAMFSQGIVMPTQMGTFAEGIAEVTAALDADPLNRTSRIEWEPVRTGISADGQHGFTFGYMTAHRPDSTRVPLKYLAYWVKEEDGWKVAAYKRARAGEDVPITPLPPALPEEIVASAGDEATLSRHAESLRAAEQGFSDEAQVIGLGPAFHKWGSPDAANMMSGPSWIVGAEAISQAVGAGSTGPSPVSWSADRVIVASSGDLGVTFGRIRPNDAVEGDAGPGSPFFTIWRRTGPALPWRYVAE